MSDDWEQVGRKLLAQRLELTGETARDAFLNARRRVTNEKDLTEEDINQLRSALEEAKYAVEIAAEASPETEPMPDPFDFLEGDARSSFAAEAKRRSDPGE